ncbi:UNKNOWN [Stylonychia lemnae]|uniref:Uncharacterized protein n=1 Tax=Stylonychia lemnae TaxID=5949 RepID=A0A078B0I3_STYLE|nr:UNKNOWN [Stylonychia lemnae]|eukprot:CDW88039.1 UNKNOWN [Stylonychia lemnae]
MLTYSGPAKLDGLVCKTCEYRIVNEEIKVKSAPSENWKEVVELWQCHDEDFSQFIDLNTKLIKIPDEVCLIRFNQIVLSQKLVEANQVQGDPVICKGCNQITGTYIEGQYCIFIDMIQNLRQYFDFSKDVLAIIFNHGLDNLKQDLLFINMDDNKQIIKIKVLGSHMLVMKNKAKQFEKSIKVLYNQIDNTNPDVFELLTQFNKTFKVKESEFQILKQILEEGQKFLHKKLQTFKNGLYQISYLIHDFK